MPRARDDRQIPYCVLNLSIPAEAVDVNVHPNKLEVRFKEDFPVREHVQAAVEAAFADGAAPLRAVAPSAPDSPPPEVPPPADADAPPPPEQIAMAQPAFGAPETPAAPASIADFAPRREEAHVLRESSLPPVAPPMPWRESAPAQRPEPPAQSEEKRFAPPRVEPLGTAPILIGQIFSTYLLVQRGDALLIIDQHAAHERILYEKFRRQVDEERRSQPLLTPYLFDVTLREAELLTENLDRLRSMGFEIEPFGERAFRVSAVRCCWARRRPGSSSSSCWTSSTPCLRPRSRTSSATRWSRWPAKRPSRAGTRSPRRRSTRY